MKETSNGRNILLLYMSLYSRRIGNNGKHMPQTNEAAVYEMQKDKEERPDLILALCSESVRTKRPDNTTTTLEYFEDKVLSRAQIPAEKFRAISIPDQMEEEEQTEAIRTILDHIQSEDKLYIDLSGGMRDTAMLLVTVARYIKDIRGVETKKVFYAELNQSDDTSILHDRTNLYHLFDLISAVDEFFSTGSAKKLKSCFDGEGEVIPALQAINTFSDDLALCKVDKLPNDLKTVARELKNRPVAKNSLVSMLYAILNERFETEFKEMRSGGKDGLPAWCRWCAEHGMYQQALTLLCEEMPEYICRHVLLQPTPKGLAFMEVQPQNKSKSWTMPLFHYHFCRMRLMREEKYRSGDDYTADLRLMNPKKENKIRRDKIGEDKTTEDENILYRIACPQEITKHIDTAEEEGFLQYDHTQRQNIETLILQYQKVIQYRNQINHASDYTANFCQGKLLSLSVPAVKAVLNETADILQAIQPCKLTKNVETLDVKYCLGKDKG